MNVMHLLSTNHYRFFNISIQEVQRLAKAVFFSITIILSYRDIIYFSVSHDNRKANNQISVVFPWGSNQTLSDGGVGEDPEDANDNNGMIFDKRFHGKIMEWFDLHATFLPGTKKDGP